MLTFLSLKYRIVASAFTVLTLFAASSTAQTGSWSVPSSGYVFDSIARNVRPVSGFVGSAVLGAPVATGIDWASIAPDRKSSLVEMNGSLFWIPDLSASATSQALDRVPLARQALWSADASQVVILSNGGQLDWVNNFGADPVPLSTWNLGSASRIRRGADGQVRAGSTPEKAVWSLLAADSAADQVMLSFNSGESSQLWLASSTAPPVRIQFAGTPVAAAFTPDAGGVFVADAAGHRVVEIQNLRTSPLPETVISSALYVNDPSALAVSSDGNRLFVADKTDDVIRVFDLTAAQASSVSPELELATSTVPESLTAFAQDRYLMNAGNAGARTGDPLYFLDTGVSVRVAFVPRGE